MNLFELQEEYNEKLVFIKTQREKIKIIENRMENLKASQIKNINVLGQTVRKDLADLIHEKVKLENDINEMYDELSVIIPTISELEVAYKKIGDRDKQIYIQRKIWGYSPVKIGVKWGLTDRQVQKIVKKVENSLKVRKSSPQM